jgi:hypothetical protein
MAPPTEEPMQMQHHHAVPEPFLGRTEAQLGKLDDKPQWEV